MLLFVISIILHLGDPHAVLGSNTGLGVVWGSESQESGLHVGICSSGIVEPLLQFPCWHDYQLHVKSRRSVRHLPAAFPSRPNLKITVAHLGSSDPDFVSPKPVSLSHHNIAVIS